MPLKGIEVDGCGRPSLLAQHPENVFAEQLCHPSAWRLWLGGISIVMALCGSSPPMATAQGTGWREGQDAGRW